MKNIRKAVALLLVLVMCVSLCCMSASAANDTDELLAVVKAEAAQKILEGLLAREENIEFGYAIKYKVDMATAQTILSSAIEAGKAFAVASALVTAELETVYNAALTHNGVPTQGDYLAHNIAKHSFTFVNYDFSQIATKGILIVKVKLSVDYRTTLAQEEAVTTALTKVVADLGLGEGASDYDKVKAFYDWLSGNVVRNDPAVAFYDKYPLASSAYGALVDKSATCEGYALAFYRFCLKNGIDCRIVTQETDSTPHVWNVVKIDDSGYYYYIDCSNADSNAASLVPGTGIKEPMFLKGTTYWANFPVFTAGDQYINLILYPDFAKTYPVSKGSYYPAGTEHDCYNEGMLIHHAAKDDKGTEYWQCRECGKRYSDKFAAGEMPDAGGTTEPDDPEGGGESGGTSSFFNSFTSFFSNFFANFLQFFRSFFKFC